MNLLAETKEALRENGLSLKDVLWFGTSEFQISGDIQVLLDIEYDDGYGGNEIPLEFIMVGSDFWLERHEYDGSEWWEYKKMPIKPIEIRSFNKLIS